MRILFLSLALLSLSFSAHARPLADLVKTPFTSPREAAVSIRALGLALQRQHDHRALFPLIYALTIEATERRLAAGGFRNPRWVSALVVNYANLYRETIRRELSGKRESLPLGWQLEFGYVSSASAHGRWQADLDVVYGIHVHIARDLVEALLITPTKFTTPSLRADFLLITDSLREAMPRIWRLFRNYQQDEQFLPSFQQSVMLKWIADLRYIAWENAESFSPYPKSVQARLIRDLDIRTTRRSKRHGALLPVVPPGH